MSRASGAATKRRQQILQALAAELEHAPGKRITTAALARAVGVSEAALYRHFSSKARMFEGLIEFAEEAVFGRVGRILEESDDALQRCEHIMVLVLGFAERNPGIVRVLLGDALVGETPRLRERVEQFFRRLETQLKQVIREGELRGQLPPGVPAEALAALLSAVLSGHLQRFLQSGFRQRPTALWERQWVALRGACTAPATAFSP